MAKKKKRKVGNTAAKTMGWLRDDLGYPLVGKVEKWNPFVHIRQDLFGFIDIVAVKPGKVGVLAIQGTHVNFLEDHKKTLRGGKIGKKVKTWLAGKNRLWLVGWTKAWNISTGTRKIWAPVISQVLVNPLSDRLVFRDVDMSEEI